MPLLQIHDIAILQASAPLAEGPAAPSLVLRELIQDQTDAIIAGHIHMGRRIPAERIERRFRHGLRFFQLWRSETLIGSTWAVSGSARYIDELALRFPLQKSEIWLRDVFIAPDARGGKLFLHMTKLMTHAVNPDCSTVWSDVDWNNHPSMRAHIGAGFQLWRRLRAVALADQLLLRQHIEQWHLPITELEPELRALRWTEARRIRHRALIA